MARRSPRFYLQLALLLAAYGGTAYASLQFDAVSGFASLVWPPTGIALAALVLGGYALWPAVWLGAFLVNFHHGAPWLAAAVIATGNTAEAVVGTLLLRRAGLRPQLDRFRDVVSLVAFAALASTTLSAVVGTTSLWLSGVIATPSAEYTATAWWLGDLMGDLVVAPLLLVLATTPFTRPTLARALEAVALLSGAVLVTCVLFVGGATQLPPAYLMFPVVLWAATRFGPRGTVLITALLEAATVIGTARGGGPFAAATLSGSLVQVVIFLAVLAATGLILAALTSELDSERGQLHAAVAGSERSSAFKAAVLDSALDCVIAIDHEGKIVEFNPAAERTFGYARADVLGKEMAGLLVPEALRESHRRGLARYLTAGTQQVLDRRLELPALRSDGSEFPAEVYIHRLEMEGPSVFTGYLRDISERRSHEDALERYRQELEQRVQERTQELHRSQQRYRSIVDSVSDYAIVSIDTEGRVNSWNRGAQRLTGFAQEDVLGKHFSLFYTPEDAAAGRPGRTLEVALQAGRSEDVGWRVRKDGTRFWANIVTAPMRDDADLVTGFVKVTRDLTERKRMEELEEALRMRDEFLSVASHELKTPITSLHLQLQRLDKLTTGDAKPPSPSDLEAAARIRRAIETSRKSASKLVALLDGLLDVTRIRLGRLSLDREMLDLAVVTHEVVARFAEDAHLAHTTISVHATRVPAGHWDSNRIDQVITNLLSNAIKYGAGKPIEVEVGVNPERHVATLDVRDHGLGITAEMQPRLFQRFERGETSRKIGGLGLGLYITAQIVEAHGGTIRVASEPGAGSTFTVELPL